MAAQSKRLTILLMACSALLFPAAAQAELSNWQHSGVDITGEVTIPLEGGFSYSGGTSCPGLASSLTLQPGSTGSVTEYAIEEPAECEVTGTLKSLGCTALGSLTAESLPWTAHNTSSHIRITETKTLFHYTGGAFCPKTVTVEGEMTATPDDAEAIKVLTLGGTLSSSLGTNLTVGGTLEPTNGGDVATYGLNSGC